MTAVSDTSSQRWITIAAAVVTAIGIGLATATFMTSRKPAPPTAAATRAAAPKPILSAPPARPFLTGDSESVDDQVEWLDAHNLIYFRPNADGNIIRRLPTDSGEAPQPFVRSGFSPEVVR